MAKQTITLETLTQLGRATLKEPIMDEYCNEDSSVVVACHKNFLVAVARERYPQTRRLNASSVAGMIKNLFKLISVGSQLFGDLLAHAYDQCMLAGCKATSSGFRRRL
jgi:hypothetical protein